MANEESHERNTFGSQGGWVTIAVAALGILGTLGSGAIGYQSGALSVNKDYAQMAMRNLQNENTSPELRSWSVEVLNKLAPIPFDETLRDQLIINRYVTPDIPQTLSSPCPDLLKEERAKDQRLPDDKSAAKFILAYEECRIRYDGLMKWHNDVKRELGSVGINNSTDDKD